MAKATKPAEADLAKAADQTPAAAEGAVAPTEPVQAQAARPVKKTVRKAKQAVAEPAKPANKVEAAVENVTPTNGDLTKEVKEAAQEAAISVEEVAAPAPKPPIAKQAFDKAKTAADPLAQKMKDQVKMTTDQIENSRIVNDVRKAAEDARTTIEKSPITSMVHKVLLASIGAVALAQEEIEEFVNRLVERGEIAEADGKRMLKDVFEQRKKAMDKAQAVAADVAEAPKRVADDVEKRVENVLAKMNIPSKDEIDALSTKITALTKKVDELKKTQ